MAQVANADLDVDTVAAPWTAKVVGIAQDVLKPAAPLATVVPLRPHAVPQAHGREHPFAAELLANQRITGRGSARDIRHLELSLEGYGLAYEPGDALGVWPRNPPALVDAVLAALEFDGDAPVAHAGNELPLRIDANQGWSVETAIATLQALKEFGIEHCEEPIARWNFMALPEVRKKSPIKIMSDESCFDEHDAERLAKLNACDYFNVKLGKSGGIFHALKIVEVAKAHNLKLQVGCFMESRLAITALVHFAYSSDLIVHYDLDTPLMLKEDPVVGGMQFLENGFVEIDDAVGIGATIDEKYLKSSESITI